MLSVVLDCCTGVFDAIVPLRCAACGDHGAQICRPCRERLAADPLVYRAATAFAPPVVALGSYSGFLRAAVLGLKFRSRRVAARRLGEILGSKLKMGLETDAVAPVPLHPRRLLLRGYNQAETIAVGVASALGAALVPEALVRARETRAQSALALPERQTNVMDAFDPGPCAFSLRGARVMLIDDVVTSGATIAACTSALRSAGVGRITAAALAIKL